MKKSGHQKSETETSVVERRATEQSASSGPGGGAAGNPWPSYVLFYRAAVAALVEAGLPFLVGGAYALRRYTGIHRHTKDFDIFVRPEDASRVLDRLAAVGYRTELPYPHWLGKAHGGDDEFVDVIFSSGNGVAVVDDLWFENSAPGEVLGLWLPVCPAEEMIWSKSFVCERERYDGADVAHLIRAQAHALDWDRLLWRFGENWRVLFSHLVLFGFIYPSERAKIPLWVMEELIARISREVVTPPPRERVCAGTLLSREQYLVDVDSLDYTDARLGSQVRMTFDDIQRWTNAITGERAVYEHGDDILHHHAHVHAPDGRGRGHGHGSGSAEHFDADDRRHR